ncbi:hypothetical protein [Baekduia sp. Peel2402]|uniref:hypothetical protein n=1 Tax=Baekduia sp. Peel2402 TaxID=3458296 RepID=UPI00403EEB6C
MYDQRTVYGPFHRLEAPTGQDTKTLVKQVLSGELWGYPPLSGGDPRVKAYRNALPEGESGFEFWAFAEPDNWGRRVFWRTANPFVEIDTNEEVVKLKLAFVKITQDLHP